MQTAIALTLFAGLIVGLGSIYVRSGARRWSIDRDPLADPLGEPPVRAAALIAVIVAGIALASSGGGAAQKIGSTEQAFGDEDLSGQADGSAAYLGSDGSSIRSPRQPPADRPAVSGASVPNDRSRTKQPEASPLPAYGRLVVRARKAAERRGAAFHWYPRLADRAASASRRRAR